MKYLFRALYLFLVNAFIFYIAEKYILVDRVFITPVITGHFVIGFFSAVFNTFLKPILKIITLPFRWLTLGLFGIFLNGILIYVLAWVLGQNNFMETTFSVQGGIMTYVLLGIILGIGNSLLKGRRK